MDGMMWFWSGTNMLRRSTLSPKSYTMWDSRLLQAAKRRKQAAALKPQPPSSVRAFEAGCATWAAAGCHSAAFLELCVHQCSA